MIAAYGIVTKVMKHTPLIVLFFDDRNKANSTIE